MKIKVGDNVVVTTGKDAGKKSVVLKVSLKHNTVVVKDVNMVTKHVKKTAERAGERVQFEASMDASNVMLLDSTGGATRVGYAFDEKGKKIRIEKATGNKIKETFKKA